MTEDEARRMVEDRLKWAAATIKETFRQLEIPMDEDAWTAKDITDLIKSAGMNFLIGWLNDNDKAVQPIKRGIIKHHTEIARWLLT